MNIINLIGRTCNDVEVRYAPTTQTAVGVFTLAVDRKKKEDGTDFIKCKVWGRKAEIFQKVLNVKILPSSPYCPPAKR